MAFQTKTSAQYDEVNLIKLIKIFWEKKFLITAITACFAILSVIISLSLPNTYTSKSLWVPTNTEDSLSSKLSLYSSLGGIAGVSIPGEEATKSQEGIARIRSFDFFSKHFLPNVKLENIIAVKSWSQIENKIYYDKKLFDASSGEWVRDVKYPKTVVPSEQEAYKFYEKYLSISEDKKTSFISISIDHKSPVIAKKWMEIIYNEINESFRAEDAENARESISFLNQSIETTKIQPLIEASSSLLEEQMKTLMLVSANKDYVFKVIDSPIIPEKKSAPNRVLICILGTLIGGFFSLMFVFLKKIDLFKEQ